MSETKTLPVLIREAGELASLLAESGGEVTPELEAQIDQSNISIGEKADRYGFVLRALGAQQKMAEEMLNQWHAFSMATGRAIENIENRMMFGMQQLNTVEISGNQSIFRLQANPPSVEIQDQTKIPGEYLVTKMPKPPETVPDKKLIGDALKQGLEIPGAILKRSVRLVHKAGAKRLS